MIPKHKILYVCRICDYMVDPLHSIFLDSFLAFMSFKLAVDISNNGLSYKQRIRLVNDQFLINFNARLEVTHNEPVCFPT